jgi:hypothetical protein
LANFVAIRADRRLPLRSAIDEARARNEGLKRFDALGFGDWGYGGKAGRSLGFNPGLPQGPSRPV